jgi:lipoyl-dependent peroxiredoxin
VIRKTSAVWRGSGRAGNGDLSSESGVLVNTPYSQRTRFENQRGTNPEELSASVPNLDQDTFDRLAQDAEQNCPVSRVLRAEIVLDPRLV